MFPSNVGVVLVLLVLSTSFVQGGFGDSLIQSLGETPFAGFKNVIGNPLSLITDNTNMDSIVKNPLKAVTDLFSGVDLSEISLNPTSFIAKSIPAGFGDSLTQGLGATPFTDLKKVIGNPLSLITENTTMDSIVKDSLKGVTDLLSVVDLSEIPMNPRSFIAKYMPSGFGDSLIQGIRSTPLTDFQTIGNSLSLFTEKNKIDAFVKNPLKDVADLISFVDLSDIPMNPNSIINKSLPSIAEMVYTLRTNLKGVTDLVSGVDLSKIPMNSSIFIIEYFPNIMKLLTILTDLLLNFIDS